MRARALLLSHRARNRVTNRQRQTKARKSRQPRDFKSDVCSGVAAGSSRCPVRWRERLADAQNSFNGEPRPSSDEQKSIAIKRRVLIEEHKLLIAQSRRLREEQ
ncbi:MAG: hypothetical protein JWL59_1930 [Chthoniobacteraceae bacterium]|nr:hypothetical protein [Chthoniobacteraceae bacterium]